MIFFEVKKLTGELIITNIAESKNFAFFSDNKNLKIKELCIRSGYKEIGEISIWIIVENEKSYVNSNRLFNKLFEAYLIVSQDYLRYFLKKIKIHSHTLRTINGRMKQKIDGLAKKEDFQGKNYQESLEKISKRASVNIQKTADTICFLNKRIGEIDDHIEGFDVLYMGDEKIKDISLREVNIKKVMLNIISPFLSEFEEKGVDIRFQIEDDYAEKNKIQIDYRLFNLAFNNFLDNAVKYTKPESVFLIGFEKKIDQFQIKFKMMSNRIDKDELNLVLTEGYSGRHALFAKGNGIGMSVVQKALELTKMEMIIQPEYSKSETVSGIKYIENRFIFKSF